MSVQMIKTPTGDTLVVLPLDEYETLRDAADHAAALGRVAAGEETLSLDEAMAHAEAPTPLHFWRRKRDMTQAALAQAVEASPSYIADIERGARKGDVHLYKKLAAVLRVRMEDLVAD